MAYHADAPLASIVISWYNTPFAVCCYHGMTSLSQYRVIVAYCYLSNVISVTVRHHCSNIVISWHVFLPRCQSNFLSVTCFILLDPINFLFVIILHLKDMVF